jgi:hypothetical protein
MDKENSVHLPIIGEYEHRDLDIDISVRAQNLYALYGWAVDYGDFDLLTSILAPDIRITRGDVTYEGVDAFLDVYHRNWAADWSAGKHYISNVFASRDDDGCIRSRAYFQALFVRSDRTSLVVGRYDDSLVEINGKLCILHKRIYVEGTTELPESIREWGGYQLARVK